MPTASGRRRRSRAVPHTAADPYAEQRQTDGVQQDERDLHREPRLALRQVARRRQVRAGRWPRVAARTMASAITSAASAPICADIGLAGPPPGGQREHRVAVARRVRRDDRAREAVVRHLRHAVDARPWSVSRWSRPRRWSCSRRGRGAGARSRRAAAAGVGQRAVGAAHAGDDLAGGGIDDVAHRVDRDDRGDDRARWARAIGGADARLHRRPGPPDLPTVAPAPAPTLPSATRRGGGGGGLVAAVGRRANLRIPPTGRSKRMAAGTIGTLRACRTSSPCCCSSRQRTAPGRRVEPEGAAARQHHACTLSTMLRRVEQIGLARAGRAAALRRRRRRRRHPRPRSRCSRWAARLSVIDAPTLSPSTAVRPRASGPA